MINIKNEKITENYEMVSFDVKFLFTLVPLEHTIDLITKIFEKHEITTVFTKNEMKELLTISTRNDIYTQIDGMAMGSPLGSIIAKTFMVELESMLVPKLNDHVNKWRRFVDDTFAYDKCGSIEYVLSVLNSFHDNIKFTMNKRIIIDCLFLIFY